MKSLPKVTMKASSPKFQAPSEAIYLDLDSTDSSKVGAWEKSLFACFSNLMPNCCMAWCLPFVSMAQIAHRLGVGRYQTMVVMFLIVFFAVPVLALVARIELHKTLQYYGETADWDPVEGYAGKNSDAKAAALVALALAAYLFYIAWIQYLRSKTRDRFQISGSCAEDYCAAYCCSWCAIAQMATQVKSYTPGRCAFGPPDTLAAYE